MTTPLLAVLAMVIGLIGVVYALWPMWRTSITGRLPDESAADGTDSMVEVAAAIEQWSATAGELTGGPPASGAQPHGSGDS